MKSRAGFVSNSSSSSFIVSTQVITAEQLEKIKNYTEVAQEMGWDENELKWDMGWNLTESKGLIEIETSMDNFDMHAFLVAIGIDKDDIKGGNWW